MLDGVWPLSYGINQFTLSSFKYCLKGFYGMGNANSWGEIYSHGCILHQIDAVFL